MKYYIGIDVGTGSARAGIFDENGNLLFKKAKKITTWEYEEVYREQSSDEIWENICEVVREVIELSKVDKKDIKGIGFDATCSLVALDENGDPVSLSKSLDNSRNVILWMDHRAEKETEFINKTHDKILDYVGGSISIEMEIPKILWVKNNLYEQYKKISYYFDLPDFLVYKATGEFVRSMCSLSCKWTYLSYEGKWDEGFFKKINLDDLLDNDFQKIGSDIRKVGEKAGILSEKAAKELGLEAGVSVAVSMIDAHAGAVGVLGIDLEEKEQLNKRIALIAGTSNCHMAVSQEKRFIKGVWGPYYSALFPDVWLNEGGQSAAGALIDYVVENHSYYNELKKMSLERGENHFEILNDFLYENVEVVDYTACDLHYLPYFLGNRSPRSDHTLRGSVVGLTLDNSISDLAKKYLAVIQSIAYGTKHIIDELNKKGYEIDEIYLTGGAVNNKLMLEQYSNITKCKIVVPKEKESVLLGAAILGALSDSEDDFFTLMNKMSGKGFEVLPNEETFLYHGKKYKVFEKMYEDFMGYREIMGDK